MFFKNVQHDCLIYVHDLVKELSNRPFQRNRESMQQLQIFSFYIGVFLWIKACDETQEIKDLIEYYKRFQFSQKLAEVLDDLFYWRLSEEIEPQLQRIPTTLSPVLSSGGSS